MFYTNFRFLVLPALMLLASTGFAQTSGIGSINSGLAKGGAGSTALASKLGSLVDRGVFKRVANKSKTTTSSRSKSKTTKPKPGAVKQSGPLNLADASALKFRPIGNSGIDENFADLLTTDPEVKDGLLNIFSETKKAYDIEAGNMGRENDLAFALTFFIATVVTVYNDGPEPSDTATESLYNALSESMLESEEIVNMSNQDKQMASDTLVYVSGLLLAGYITSKDTDDEETFSIYRQAAAETLLSLTGISADKMEFTRTGLDIKP